MRFLADNKLNWLALLVFIALVGLCVHRADAPLANPTITKEVK